MLSVNNNLLKKILTKNVLFKEFTYEIKHNIKDFNNYIAHWDEIVKNVVNPTNDKFNCDSIDYYFNLGHIKELDKYIYTTLFDIEKWRNCDGSNYDGSDRLSVSHVKVHSKEEFLKSDLLLKEINDFECEVLLPHSLSKLYFDIDILDNSDDTLEKVLLSLTKCIRLLFDIGKGDVNYNLTFAISSTDRTRKIKENDSTSSTEKEKEPYHVSVPNIIKTTDDQEGHCLKYLIDKKNKIVNTYNNSISEFVKDIGDDTTFKKESYHITVPGIKIDNERRHCLGYLMNKKNRISHTYNNTLFEFVRDSLPKSCDPLVYNDIQAFRMLNRSKGDGRFKKPLGYVMAVNDKVMLKDSAVPKIEDFLITDEGQCSYDNLILTLDNVKGLTAAKKRLEYRTKE
jgi:hypothetical protein